MLAGATELGSEFSLYVWLLIAGTSFMAGLFGTGCLLQYARARYLYDIPGHRSSHDRPVPRGGGLAIAITILTAILILTLSGHVSSQIFIALFVAAILVTIIGWLDDHKQLPVSLRAGSYLLAAIWFVVWLGIPSEIDVGVLRIWVGTREALEASVLAVPGWLVILLVILGITWFTNLYNFMDGTDGLAGLQAVLASIAGTTLFWLQGAEGLAMLCLVVSAVSAGFLFWNWSPARIFMGDSGSCLLGFTFAALALLGETNADLPMILWLILLAGFFWDASLTLLMRILKHEKWYSAHRSHAYQRLVQMGFSHGQLAWSFLALNIFVLWPLAWWGYTQSTSLPMAVIFSSLVVGVPWLVIQICYGQRTSGDKDIA